MVDFVLTSHSGPVLATELFINIDPDTKVSGLPEALLGSARGSPRLLFESYLLSSSALRCKFAHTRRHANVSE